VKSATIIRRRLHGCWDKSATSIFATVAKRDQTDECPNRTGPDHRREPSLECRGAAHHRRFPFGKSRIGSAAPTRRAGVGPIVFENGGTTMGPDFARALLRFVLPTPFSRNAFHGWATRGPEPHRAFDHPPAKPDGPTTAIHLRPRGRWAPPRLWCCGAAMIRPSRTAARRRSQPRTLRSASLQHWVSFQSQRGDPPRGRSLHADYSQTTQPPFIRCLFRHVFGARPWPLVRIGSIRRKQPTGGVEGRRREPKRPHAHHPGLSAQLSPLALCLAGWMKHAFIWRRLFAVRSRTNRPSRRLFLRRCNSPRRARNCSRTACEAFWPAE